MRVEIVKINAKSDDELSYFQRFLGRIGNVIQETMDGDVIVRFDDPIRFSSMNSDAVITGSEQRFHAGEFVAA